MKSVITIKKSKIFFLFLLIWISNLSFCGQISKNPSFESLRLAYDKYEKNDIKALPFVQKLISKSKKENNFSKLVMGYQDAIYFEKNKFLKLKYADSAIVAAFKSKDNNLITSAYLGKGIVYYSNFRKYMPALNEYLKAFSYVKNSDNKYLHYKVVYHLGVVKSYLGYYDEALIHFNSCIQFFESQLKSDLHPIEIFNHKKGYLNSVHQANVCYRSLHHHKKSDSLIALGLTHSMNQKDFIIEYNYFLKSKGVSLYYKGQYKKALPYLSESLKGLVKVDDFVWVSVNYFFQGKSLLSLNRKDLAIKKFEKIDSIFNKHQFILPELRNNYEILINIYKKENNVDKQLYYMKQLIKADRIINKDFIYLAPKIYKEYDAKSLYESKTELESRIHKRNILVFTFISVSLTLLVLYIIRYRRDSLIQAQYKSLEKKYLEALNSASLAEKEMTMFSHMGEVERHRKLGISKEIETEILKKLKEFEINKGFTQKGLTQKILASKLDTNTYYLSLVINENKKMNFNKYLSELRIQHITNLLFTDKKYLNYTVEALAEECGISSRQNFSALFYELNGIRPTDFIKQRKQEMKNT
ncbi:helix-turn-helix domain-containing protein [Cloacibacterium normanense]|uniref:helix-turn-helix domain-containing protein n=1 Tax=Cloacibacterium normanense TaxID=237258 RepID=UPI00391C614F